MEQIVTEKSKKRLLEKKELLDKTAIQLKTEFIGIDIVIDQMINAVTPWFLFPEIQDRPVIVNLWGLTGIGKTSLIKRFTELIDFASYYFRFDMGESTGQNFDMADTFDDIYDNCDGEPFIIGLDEFQLARTINEEQEEVDKASSRVIWDLLDCGKFDIIRFNYYMDSFSRLIKRLNLALVNDIEVENGVVISDVETFKEIVDLNQSSSKNNEDEDEKEKITYFVTDYYLDIIYPIVQKSYLSKQEFRKKLCEFNGEETIEFLIRLYKKSLKPKTIDCTKSLIFVMGNLDEVYSMTRNFNPDISANEFHLQSKKITITQVKEALLNRFRSEQIARLGNIHIIYPSFNEEAFYGIIELELNKINKKVYDICGLRLKFEKSILDLIYSEGVYPTQGTRPLFTTIHQTIHPFLSRIMNEIYLNNVQADEIVFSVDTKQYSTEFAILKVDFMDHTKNIHTITEQQPLVLGKLRKEKQNDQQAIVAVHESGHAILSSVLMKTIPETVLSVTADAYSEGFVLARPEWHYISKKEIINRIAVMLGGMAAERIIFGDENVTIGSQSDLSNATRLATHALYLCGMGKTRATLGNENIETTPTSVYDNINEGVNQEIKELIKSADILAEQTLQKQKTLLLKMADYLSDKRSLNKIQVQDFIKKYAVDFNINEIITDAEHIFYRKHLKELVKNLNN